MVYEDLASKNWLNLPSPRSIGLLSPEVNRYQQIMAQMPQYEVAPVGLLSSTGGYNPAIYDVSLEQSQAANILNNLLNNKFGGGNGGILNNATQQNALA